MIDFAKVLNAEQCAAATAGDGPMLVLAAAGTGKTRTLVHRVAHLAGRGVPAERILLLTFTNRAAREMLDRAEQLVGPMAGIWSGTFHHVCARFLRRYASFVGYKPHFDILDEDDQSKLVRQCVKEAVKEPKDFQKPSFVLKLISDAANAERSFREIAQIHQTKAAYDLEEMCKVAELYENRKRELGAMDFDDLLVNGLKLLKEHDGVREQLQEQFLHVLVDEYQDTNSLQAQFTDILAAKHGNIMAVGDDFQCIYTWRGAKFENIMRFPERWPGCRILKLERNYRSLAPILDVANVVMKDVRHQFEKTLRPARTAAGALPKIYHLWDGHAQAENVVKLAAKLHESGVAWKDVAVLYRSHFSSIEIQLALTRAHVPFRITSGVGVFEQLHVKDVLAFLRLALDPHSELSFLRLAQLMPGMGEKTAQRVWAKLGKAFNPLNGMERMNLGEMLPPKSKTAWYGIAKAYALAEDHLKHGEDRMLVEDFVHHFYGDHLSRAFEEDEAAERLGDLAELTTQIASFDGGLTGFLEEVALMTSLDAAAKADLPADHMHLTTIHQAKGMEWPVVILPWATQGYFPSARSMEDGNLDEERRLFYVAVTRAKDRLYLFCPRSRKTPEGGSIPCEDSMFVKEIPDALVEKQEIHTYQASYDAPRRSGGYGGRGGGWNGGWRANHVDGGYKVTWRR
ncbi:MAG: ATP-dependent helicase [Kiritimatiellae bacterium]|nr:ATP-dependent helicase [Kiritimatiellia bacterium]